MTLRSLPRLAAKFRLWVSLTLSHQHTISIIRGQQYKSTLFLGFVSPYAAVVEENRIIPFVPLRGGFYKVTLHPPITSATLFLDFLTGIQQNYPGPFLFACNIPAIAREGTESSLRKVQSQHPGIYFHRCGMQKLLSHFLSTHLHSWSLPPPLFSCLQRHWTPDTSDRNYISVIQIQKPTGKWIFSGLQVLLHEPLSSKEWVCLMLSSPIPG